ncbi:MAG: type IV pilus twitching motility protein PilT [Candidatus Omnitrophica bacterium]|nr:type IV pilus twitching motility protein PilT [Candidatus Omnitrophota bacterium]
MHIQELLRFAVKNRASDLHITENSPPILRINGRIVATELAALTREDTKRMVYSLLNDKQKEIFEQRLELDFSFSLDGKERFRINVHSQRGSIEAAFRVIPSQVPTLDQLGLPVVATELARKPNGLVIVTGPTGSGKSTTLAAMVDLINTEQQVVVITIEDPIEYIFYNKKSIIKQREVFADTRSFADALKHVLRQDPDVVVVGEMRDLETISTTLTAAETGHLVLATLHTPDASQTIDRVIDVFPPHQQEQIKIQFSGCLQGVISQELLPRKDGRGRVLATEVMIATTGIRNLIREHSTEQIPTLIQTGAQYGMHMMDKSLRELYVKGLVSYEEVIVRAKNPEEFR